MKKDNTNKIMGIYKFTNTITGHVYIGSSKRIYDRFTDHKRNLKNNSHENKYFQRAYNKYGFQSFEYTIIEFIEKESDLLLKENYWIKENKSTDPAHGYNILHYDRRYNIISDNNLVCKTKRYFVISPNGNTYDVSNLPDFCRSHELCCSSMHKVAKRKIKHSKYWRCWEYDKKPDHIDNIFDFKEACRKNKAEINRKNIAERNANQHKWQYQFKNSEGTIFHCKTVKNFCKEQNINPKEMLKIANGSRLSFKGWTCLRFPIV